MPQLRIKERWVRYPKVDLPLALAGLSLLFVNLKSAGFYALAPAVAETGGVLLGMGAVVYGLFQQSSSERIRTIRVAYRTELRRNWAAVHVGFVISCGLALASIPVWAAVPRLAVAIVGASAALLVLRAARMAWLLRLYLKIDAADSIPSFEVRKDIAKR